MSETLPAATKPLLVHIDMKGGPPTPRYLIQLLSLFKTWGASGILIEWEDMFPWDGELQVLAREGHYSREEVLLLLQAAIDLELEVVPLVQTFGHLEFVLKHPEFSQLREIPLFPNSLRPVDPDTEPGQSSGFLLVCEMVRQIINLHHPQKIHIGCDEVWYLGKGPITSVYLENKGVSVTQLFLQHLRSVAKFASSEAPQPKVLVWDDMMRTADVDDLMILQGLVEPVVWNYGENLQFSPGMFQRYSAVFGSSIWGGSAWRGASGSCSHSTPIRYHIANHLAWLTVEEIKAGLILTGWARYDHFATHCELLPVSLPSLCCCLAVMKNGGWTSEIHSMCSKQLMLKDQLNIEHTISAEGTEEPVFTGSRIYSLIFSYLRILSNYETIFNGTTQRTWMNPWQIKQGFLNPIQVRGFLLELKKLQFSFRALSEAFKIDVPNVLHAFTSEEWIGTNIDPKLDEIATVLNSLRELPCLQGLQEMMK
ncbi:hexosaminidase D [Eurytemora carolleeae]|uniref:hexosaminidase D n=1 Tax=Eurytemora carolleeae TaxID=1294199 RepID=UPI000C77A886|nr:hexosaminidase D [Eurytemora carolleeae]|eukprot:XP_023334110.1 hexosaminidase D-like [Eurytemora affinis]